MSGVLSRRGLLLGLGASVAASSLSRRLLGDPPPAPPKRLVLLMQPNGTQQVNFWPREGFTSPILSPILSDPRLAAKTTVVRGVSIPPDAGGANANEHDVGFARMFTGAPVMAVGGQAWGGAPSVDQTVARAWGVDTLTLAIHTSAIEPHPKPGCDHRRSFVYVGPATHKTPTVDPIDAYRRLFTEPEVATGEVRRRLLARRSALDAAAANLRDLQSRLGAEQRAMTDVHLESLRQLELRLSESLDGRRSPGAACGAKPLMPREFRATAPELLVSDERAIPELVGDMIELIAAAFGCGASRIATLQLGFGGAKWRFAWEGIDLDVHQALAHRDTADEGVDPAVTAHLVRANRWYATQVAALARKLDAIPEGNGTVLDNTLLVWANEMGRGDHDLRNVPIVLLGGVGHRGGRLVDEGPQPFQRVGCTVLQAMGQGAAGFGDHPDGGGLRGI